GGHQLHKTTKENLKNYMQSLDYDILPRTTRDAVHTTFGLGYEHLWVDSMCIVQDDAKEMVEEVAKMPSIYSNALCTIAAKCSDSVEKGFLSRPKYTVFGFDARWASNRGRLSGSGKVHGIALNNYGQEPLEARGWALQERILSQRILDFGLRQLRWHCDGLQGGTFLTDGWTPVPEAVSHKPRSSGGYWEGIVEEYTKRRLTFPSDRAVAISGIAQALG
ncbi:hypothetical protein M011DRAFT_410626, partial [Sporormia fimetaria CBS 119925]